MKIFIGDRNSPFLPDGGELRRWVRADYSARKPTWNTMQF